MSDRSIKVTVFIIFAIVFALLTSCSSDSGSSSGSMSCGYCGSSCSAFEKAMYGGHKGCANTHKGIWDAVHGG